MRRSAAIAQSRWAAIAIGARSTREGDEHDKDTLLMDAPGSYFLLIGGTDFNITNETTYTGDWVMDLDGMISASVQLDFRAGSSTGEASVTAYFQTTLDDGNTVVDLACSVFTGSVRVVFNVAADATSTVPLDATDGMLTADTILGGVLGNRLRLKVVSVGTWTNTYLGGRMVLR
jgi:hypothetical protein